MELQFKDRVLTCSDCRGEFIFTAGEQLFFHEKQFKNDPKRCKPCKARRSGLASAANNEVPAAGLSRTETRTQCSECGIETTVPFKPTQGRPVLCRQCFQNRARPAAAPQPEVAPPAFEPVAAAPAMSQGAGSQDVAQALTSLSVNSHGEALSAEAAVQAVASMEAASESSSVASVADLQMITVIERGEHPFPVPVELVSSLPDQPAELTPAMIEIMDA